MNRRTINQVVNAQNSASSYEISHVFDFLSVNPSEQEIPDDMRMILAHMNRGVDLITALDAYTNMRKMLTTPEAVIGIANHGLYSVKNAFYSGSVFDLQNPPSQFRGIDTVFFMPGGDDFIPHLEIETPPQQRQPPKFPDVKQYLSQVAGAGTVQGYLALR